MSVDEIRGAAHRRFECVQLAFDLPPDTSAIQHVRIGEGDQARQRQIESRFAQRFREIQVQPGVDVQFAQLRGIAPEGGRLRQATHRAKPPGPRQTQHAIVDRRIHAKIIRAYDNAPDVRIRVRGPSDVIAMEVLECGF